MAKARVELLQYLDGVIEVKNLTKPMTFITPELEPILGKTYGAIVYQEQVMEICQKLAGFTLGHADQVRRFMSKKKAEKLAHEREAFVTGCAANNISGDIANELFDQMMDFASYAFNKSHAAAYAYNAYITAWLKYHYPVEFFASALNWTESKKLPGLMYEAAACGVEVLAPKINSSSKKFSIVDNKVLFGLSSVAGVKDNADAILRERENGSFASLQDFCIRVQPNSTVINHLISAGAFDAFGNNRNAMKQMADEMKDIVSKRLKKASFIASAEHVLPEIEKFADNEALRLYQTDAGFKAEITELTTVEKLEKRIENAKNALDAIDKELSMIKMREMPEDKAERMSLEKEYLGNYVTEHPMDFYPSPENVGSTNVADIAEHAQSAYGVITDLKIRNRKSDGAKMAAFTIEDRSGSIDVVMFTKPYSLYGEVLKEGVVVKLDGNCEYEEDGVDENGNTLMTPKFYANRAEEISQKKSNAIMAVSSMAAFHLDAEKAFRDEYEYSKGHPLIIYDRVMDEMREMEYMVSDRVFRLPYVEEMY